MVKNSGRNVAKARVSILSQKVLGKGDLQGSFAIFEFVEIVYSKEKPEPTIVERYVGPGCWQSRPPSNLLMLGLRLLWSPPPNALPMPGPGIFWSPTPSALPIPRLGIFLPPSPSSIQIPGFLTKKQVITESATRDLQHLLSIVI
ncbi:hypothetical protein AMTR_s00042p00217100 [Amborella trichopoda]|uniref:Uncharacterized protein n=1 Tax=Amborella trichopoda TaxID=13333 RepID=W1P194_AMBTC|nr:hypothetical protein AMTR_s00042p00217100 [Amborella trichopoda]